MISNASFEDAGASPGAAAGWTLRSACAREAIAAFTPGDSVESFERWSNWIETLDAIARAPFAPTGALETFDAWPLSLFALELTPELIAGTVVEAFEGGWWNGVAAFTWSAVARVGGVFGVGAQELFAAWRPGEVYALAFVPPTLTAAAFNGGVVELFDGAAWTTKNRTLG